VADVADGDLAQRMLDALQTDDLFVDLGAPVAPGAADGMGAPRRRGQGGAVIIAERSISRSIRQPSGVRSMWFVYE
jgi:hypothetical protein